MPISLADDLLAHTERLQALDDLDAEGANRRVQAVGTELSRGTHDVERVAVGDRHEGVGGAQVRIPVQTAGMPVVEGEMSVEADSATLAPRQISLHPDLNERKN